MKSLNAFFLVVLITLLIFSLNVYAERSGTSQAIIKKLNTEAQSLTIDKPAQMVPIHQPSDQPAQRMSSDVRQGGDVIADATVIPSIPTTLTGTTSGYNDDYEVSSGGCTSTNAPDVVYSLTPDSDQRIHIISCNSSYWTKMFLYETDSTNVFACNQYSDSCAPDYRAAFYNLDVVEGVTYYLVIDGGIGGPSGDYVVDIEVLPPTPELNMHPGLASTGYGDLMLGYEYYKYDSFNLWQGSPDNGQNWNNPTGWVFNQNPTYSSADYFGGPEGQQCDFTMVPSALDDNGADIYIGEGYYASDPGTYSLRYWDWSTLTSGGVDYHWFNMIMNDIAADDAQLPWQWGVISLIWGGDYSEPDHVHSPYITYQTSEDGYATIRWYNGVDACSTTTCEIDHGTQYLYAMYDYFDSEAGDWIIFATRWPRFNWDATSLYQNAGFTLDDGTHLMYPDVAAAGGQIVTVAQNWDPLDEADKDIVCFYAERDDLLSALSSVVAGTTDAETFPRIRHVTGTSYLCTFVKNGELYASLSENGGASWGTAEAISEVGDIVINEYRSHDAAESDGYAVPVMYEYETAKEGDISLRLIFHQVYPYPDGDGDGVPDHLDNCPTVYNDDQLDNDGDEHGDACDNCDFVYNPDQANDDADSLGNVCDNCPTADNDDQSNGDGDMHGDACDNCPQIANNDQANSDADSHGDACDNCPTADNEDQANSDADSHGDACDNCPNDDNEDQQNSDTDSHGDVCDNCPLVDNEDQADENQNGVGDACDWICGDANNDRAVNLLDITFLIAYKYKNGPEPEFLVACDVNSSGTPEAPEVNLLDITYLIAFKYREGPEPDCP